jgi:RsiW-degrading membrane proteinase PrsW (M82 family)
MSEPAPRTDGPRPWVRAGRLTGGRALVALGLATAVVLLVSATVFDIGVFAAAAVAALLPLPLYVALALWIDRFEPEPRSLLATAFLWGASVAVLVAALLNALADRALGEALGSTVAGPAVEELAKGAILVALYRRRPDEFDGIIDGLIYASMAGLGFAFVENIAYYARALANDGAGGLAVTFTLRGVLAPFSHPLFTSMAGLGLGLARQTSIPAVKRVAPFVGFAIAIALHGLWNKAAALGCVFFVVYFLVMLPAVGIVLLVAFLALKGEGRIVRERLAPEVASGLVPAHEFDGLCCVRGRLDAAVRAYFSGGRAAWRARQAFEHTASELAFLRERVARGQQPPDPELEARYLETLGAGRPRAGVNVPGSE